MKKKIYIILMNTNTLPSKFISLFTRYKYSHVVLSLDNTYTKLYSFGRKKLYNFLNSGFVTDGINSKFFKRFNQTTCIIYELPISLPKYYKLVKELKKYEKNPDKYHYDIKRLCKYIFPYRVKQRDNYYVCTQFIGTILMESGIYQFEKDTINLLPKDFTKIPEAIKIYEGLFLKVNHHD